MTENSQYPQVTLPVCFSKNIQQGKNRARQMLYPSEKAKLNISSNPLTAEVADGRIIQLITSSTQIQPGINYLKIRQETVSDIWLAFSTPNHVEWFGDLSYESPSIVLNSWLNAVNFKLGDKDCGQAGLRLPQLGALHSVLGYWTTGSTQPITVVMPTGTGKTETMIALLVASMIERLLVVVPSDILRTQLAQKFESFGILQNSGVISPLAHRPVVGQLKQAFSDVEVARNFIKKCNVVVTTPSALFASPIDVVQEIQSICSHLIIDEAHHVEASTWRRIRDYFVEKPVVQFTATPFREDGRRIAGQIIYAFPLRQAQKYNYFSEINYIPVSNFESPDEAIAQSAINQLRKDLESGFDHILMARVKRISRAIEVQELYEQLAPDLFPVILHSTLPVVDRKTSLEAIRNRQSRIIVCVDMLGEGFDLPNLKIAAIHDVHKSLGITLQFIGRFARVSDISVGTASIVTGRPEGQYDDNLRRLYSEDPDWNLIIRDLSEQAVGREREVSEFETYFTELPEEISMKNIELKMSTVVYRTHCELWNPQSIYECYPDGAIYSDPIAINEHDRVAWFVIENRMPVDWGKIETIADVRYDLHVVYWDESNQLLYINGSSTDSIFNELAKAVCGNDVELFKGETVYRAMSGIDRLVPTNVGLLDIRNLSRRFSMHVGADVIEGFPLAEAQTKTKTNIFAYGYQKGDRVSIGCSLKGRIWSYRIASSIKHWVDWCNEVGSKVSNPDIDTKEVMKGFIRPLTLDNRPPYVPLGLEWPWEIFLNTSEETKIRFGEKDWSLIDTELRLSTFEKNGPIQFFVSTPDWEAEYEIVFINGCMDFRPLLGDVSIVTRLAQFPLSDYLNKHGLTILFEQDAIVVRPGLLLKPNREIPPFSLDKLTPLDWSGINIKKESQGPNREADSIQFNVLSYIQSLEPWDVIIDDDGKGEIADIVAMRVDTNNLRLHLVHCKYSKEITAGGRLEDLYEVCGQAQKSVRWRRNIEALFQNLIRRERYRRRKHGRTGVMAGDMNALLRLQEISRQLRLNLTITIAQPGLSIEQVRNELLELLGSTELYVHEVAYANFNVLCSK